MRVSDTSTAFRFIKYLNLVQSVKFQGGIEYSSSYPYQAFQGVEVDSDGLL